MSSNALKLHSAFIWRRVHSLFGLWLVVFLLEHLLTNSQAALMFGESGMGFVRAVNFLKNLPYLHVLEICLLGVPLFVHMAWGIKYLLTSRQNTLPSDGSKPSLPKYSRNLAYSLQRITSWVVLFGIILHVGYMRFYRYPTETSFGKSASFFVRLDMDKGLYTVADRLGVRLYNSQDIAEERAQIKNLEEESLQLQEKARQTYSELGENIHYQENIASILEENQDLYFKKKWLEGLTKRSIGKGQVIAESDNFGTATLLVVRDSFSHVFTGILYTIFVLGAVFHAFNGLWTFFISWGAVLRVRTQSQAVNCCMGVMIIMGFLGLAAIWGTYFINLKH